MITGKKVRLGIFLIVVISLLIPWSIEPREMNAPTGVIVFYSMIDFIDWLSPEKIVNSTGSVVGKLAFRGPLWCMPILAILSFSLWRRNDRGILVVYRIMLGLLTLFTLISFVDLDLPLGFIGFWVNRVIILGLAVIEMCILYIVHRKQKINQV